MKGIPIFQSKFGFAVDYWKSISGNWVISIVNKFVAVLFIFSVAILVWRFTYLPADVPLWYSKPWGEEQFAHPVWLFLFPATILIFFFLNVYVSAKFSSKHLIFSQLLFTTSLIVAILSLVNLAKILFLIT